jgi:hypothetical protein
MTTKNTDVVETLEAVEVEVGVAILTPYAAHNIVNALLVEAGCKPVPPQMMYNYTTSKLRKGQKASWDYTPETGVNVTKFKAWAVEYTASRVQKEATKAAALVEDLEGSEA